VKLLAGGLVAVMALALAACGSKSAPVATTAAASPSDAAPSAEPSALPSSAAPIPSASPARSAPASRKPSTTLKKTVAAGGDTGKPVKPPTGDGVPAKGAETFTAAAGGTSVVGSGTTLVKYRVEMEDGIVWGNNPVWTPVSFAAVVDKAIAGPLGWTRSAEAPVTYPADKLNDASWSFQRVSGTEYSVRIRLATPGTVDKLCGAVGVQTQGLYSCRYGQTILVNLRRWLKGVAGFAPDVAFRDMTINHEMGHFLGFNHMNCPGAGMVAPVMQTQTIALNGCVPNAFPFGSNGTFIVGPWAPS
jgi:hypothetical protein